MVQHPELYRENEDMREHSTESRPQFHSQYQWVRAEFQTTARTTRESA